MFGGADQSTAGTLSSSSSTPAAVTLAAGQIILSTITLDMEFDKIGAPGTKIRQQFEFFLISDLAEASALPRTAFKVRRVTPGSVIVDVEILTAATDDKTAQQVANDLKMQAGKLKSTLSAGQITRRIKSFDVSAEFPSFTCTEGQEQIINMDQAQTPQGMTLYTQSLDSMIENLKGALEASYTECETIEAQLTMLAAQCSHAETETWALREQVGSMKIQFESRSTVEDFDKLRHQLHTAQNEVEYLSREVNGDQTETMTISEEQQLGSDCIKTLEDELNELTSTLRDVRRELKINKSDTVRRAEEEVIELRATVLELKEDLKSLELRRAEEVAILENEKARLGEVLASGARRCADLETEVRRLVSQNQEQQIVLDDRQKELTKSLGSNEAARASHDGLQHKYDTIQVNCQHTICTLKMLLHSKCAELEAELINMQATESDLRQQLFADMDKEPHILPSSISSPTELKWERMENHLDVLRYQLHVQEEQHREQVKHIFLRQAQRVVFACGLSGK